MKKKKTLVIIDGCQDMVRDAALRNDLNTMTAHLTSPYFSQNDKAVIARIPRSRLNGAAIHKAMVENGVDATRTFLVTGLIDSVVTAHDAGIKSIGVPFGETSLIGKFRINRGFMYHGATNTSATLTTAVVAIKQHLAIQQADAPRSRVPLIMARGTRGPKQG